MQGLGAESDERLAGSERRGGLGHRGAYRGGPSIVRTGKREEDEEERFGGEMVEESTESDGERPRRNVVRTKRERERGGARGIRCDAWARPGSAD